MSQNSDHYHMNTPTSVSPSSNNIKRLPTNQHFLATNSADLNVVTSTTRNDCSSPQSHTSPIISDVCMSSQNSVRNPSTMMKFKDVDSSNGNHFNEKYAFTLDFSSPVSKTKSEHNRISQNYTFEMSTNDEQDLHSPFELDVPICENQPLKKIQNDFLIDRMLKDETNSNYSSQHRSINQSSYTNVLNHSSPLVTPSSDHHDIDALSDAGTYIIEDDLDIAHDDEPEQDVEEPQQQQQHNDTQESISSPLSTSSPFKRYATTKRNRHGTFDIHGISSSTATSAHAVTRPIVDLNIPTHDLSSPSSSSSANLSSSSSLLSLPTESENSIRKEREDSSHQINGTKSSNGLAYVRQRPNTLLTQRPITPPQNQIKPAECFVISPTLDTKPFPNTIGNGSRRKLDAQWKTKLSSSAMPTKDTNIEVLTKKSPPSPQLSTHSNQSDTDRYSFRLRQQPRNPDTKPQPSRYLETKTQQPSASATNPKSSHQNSEYTSSKSTLRPHSSTNDQSYSSPFQRNTTIRQTMPASTQYNRPMSSSTTNKYLDDHEEVASTHPSLTKVYMNKSFALRRQRSNLVPSAATVAAKPAQQQQQQQQQQPQQSSQQSLVSRTLPSRQLLKPTPSVPSTNNSSGQTNRAVELRRARAQAKIEELAQRTRHQLQKSEQQNDVMSASWHSNASSISKKDLFGLRANPRSANNNHHLSAQKQDLSKTRTISSSSHHRSSSASPNPLGETMTSSMPTKPTKYRKGMTSSVTDETQYQRMHGSTFSEGDRCESLRDDGQRLAIKLIQLSSGILAKLKPHNITDDNDSNVRELEQLVDQLQTVNRTLTTIDASLSGPISDESLI